MWAASVNITEQERQPQIIIMSTLILSLSFITSAVVAINTGLDSAWCYNLKGEESQIRNSHNKHKNTVFNNF